jgi:5'-nucleotidase
MRILLSNDDGWSSEGIHALAKEFSELKPVIVAPERERSTTGHSLTLHKPLRLYGHGPAVHSVSGGPADCIYMAVNVVFKGKKPDLVISGINRGANLGQDVFYSGTCSAAREAANLGIPSIAVSLSLDHLRKGQTQHYDSAAQWTRRALEAAVPLLTRSRGGWSESLRKWPKGMMLNLNVPNLPYAEVKGLRSGHQGQRHYGTKILKRKDARGRPYFWMGGRYEGFAPDSSSDCHLVEQGFACVTPLELDTTKKDDFLRLRKALR